MENELPKRKNMRLQGYDYSSSGMYFVTICVKDRERLLSDFIAPSGVGSQPQIRLTEIGKIVEKNLLSCEKTDGVRIDKYVIMPDHIHAIIFLNSLKYTKNNDKEKENVLSTVIDCKDGKTLTMTNSSSYNTSHTVTDEVPSYLTKRLKTKANEMLPRIISTFKRFCNKEVGKNIFQRGFYEHVIRGREDYEARMKYICENPLRRYYEELKTKK